MTTIAGYTYEDQTLTPSSVTLSELDELLTSVLWSETDKEALRDAGEILVPQTEAILDVWYGFVGSNPHLVSSFTGADGTPDLEYLAAVRQRFGQWITDLCNREFDTTWLAYQEEIGLRHHTAAKNLTDGVASPASHVELRHVISLIVPITVTIRGFLENGESDPAKVDAMYHAWFKAVTLSVALWSRPYSPELW